MTLAYFIARLIFSCDIEGFGMEKSENNGVLAPQKQRLPGILLYGHAPLFVRRLLYVVCRLLSVVRQHFHASFFSETTGLIDAKFHLERHLDGGTKVGL